MTQPKTRPKHMLRYSPKPIEAYTKVLAGKPYGPAESKLLDTAQAWNLAYLSHDYDAEFQHKDPMFTTHVRRTLQTKLDGSGLGIGHDPTTLVGSLMGLPQGSSISCGRAPIFWTPCPCSPPTAPLGSGASSARSGCVRQGGSRTVGVRSRRRRRSSLLWLSSPSFEDRLDHPSGWTSPAWPNQQHFHKV